MNFITEEVYRIGLVAVTRWRVWIIPFAWLLFCLIMKIILINHYNSYIENNGSNTFAPMIAVVYEKHLHKIDKIAIFGALVLLFTLYKKYRKYVF